MPRAGANGRRFELVTPAPQDTSRGRRSGAGKPMQVISFKKSALFRRGMWLSAAALLAFVAIPGILDGSLWRESPTHLIPLGILGAICVYFFRNMQIHRLADEVMDCGDHLKVRRGATEEIIPFSSISMARVSTGSGIPRITVHLNQPAKLGGRIEFLPQASLWSNRSAIERVAGSLTDRASRARAGPQVT